MRERNTRANKGLSTLNFPENYVVIDIETTGLSPSFDSIIELSSLKIEDYKVVDKFSSLVNPGFKISAFIEQLTGITNEMLYFANPIDDILPSFIEFVGENHIVGHNVSFDINFIYDACIKVLNKPFSNNFTDTLRLSKRILKNLPHHRLADLSEYYNICYEGAHRALVDCQITQQCFIKLYEEILTQYSCLESFHNSLKTKYIHLNKNKG